MSLLRTARTVLPITPRRLALTAPQKRFATEGYGSSAGNPDGKNQTSQISRDLEHPGPDAPSTEGGKSGDSSTKSDSQPQQHESSSSGGNGGEKAQPKILNTSPPKKGEGGADVEQHNREMEQRSDRPAERVQDADVEKDKVGKGFWKGTGGVDKDP